LGVWGADWGGEEKPPPHDADHNESAHDNKVP
jgi:hypothetical protein